MRTFTGESQFTLMCPIMLLRVVERKEGDVRHAIQVAFARRHHGFGLFLDQIVHDRKVVRRQIPDHVNVVLEQAQVHAGGIVVVEIAQVPSSINWWICLTAPVNRNVWSTMIFRFLRSASSINSSACAVVQVNGFSTKTCLPFSRAALASSKWVQTGVTTAMTSMSGDVSRSSNQS